MPAKLVPVRMQWSLWGIGTPANADLPPLQLRDLILEVSTPLVAGLRQDNAESSEDQKGPEGRTPQDKGDERRPSREDHPHHDDEECVSLDLPPELAGCELLFPTLASDLHAKCHAAPL
jgi:hypothetical protein